MNVCRLLLTVGLLAGLTVTSQEDSPSFGDGILNLMPRDSTWSMSMAARMQFLTSVAWGDLSVGSVDYPKSALLIRRARIKLDGFAYSSKFRYKLELGLSNNDIAGASNFTGNSPRYILDAVVMWNFYENFELWLGQTKLPGNVERVISSANLQLVDRSLLNANFNIDRDQGLQLRHHILLSRQFLVREKLAVSQGEGRNITEGNTGGYEYTARLEMLPFGAFLGDGEYSGSDLKREPKPKMMLAATLDINTDAVRDAGNQGSFMENDLGFYNTNITTVFLDGVFKWQGFSFMGEYAFRNAADPIATNSDGTETGDYVKEGHGINLQAGYLFGKNLEIAGRYTNTTTLDSEGLDMLLDQYTLGFSKYLVGHKLKVQTDLSYLTGGDDNWNLNYRLQVEVHF